jgi:hypothetical protein
MAGEEVADLMAGGAELEPRDLLVANVGLGVSAGWMPTAYSLQFAVENLYRRKSPLAANESITKRNNRKELELYNPLIPRASYAEFGLPNGQGADGEEQGRGRADPALRPLRDAADPSPVGGGQWPQSGAMPM